ncbi:hypothetical protein CKAN_01073800 [Cinnamomum micranthum f. kanehirae]|uniref:TOD1/MUCI70 glycosyltransferase-like domain-containing protein n=1 Tax=Cinnamomum micranthum f. kanehirae TaxID=337451 RepID=A0A3S3MTB6_9MAGN|nr:hypothetical protein CKAN_01073800 [Cinnamomum micranthum f. kanehirae]
MRMAQYRQSGAERSAAIRGHDSHHGSNGISGGISDHISGYIPMKQGRVRRSGRSEKYRSVSLGIVSIIILLVLVITFFHFNFLNRYKEYKSLNNGQDDDEKNDMDSLSTVTQTMNYKDVKFGHGSFRLGLESRYLDRDDRRRDFEYNGDDLELASSNDVNHSTEKDRKSENQRSGHGHRKSKMNSVGDEISAGLYNEAGRSELKRYEAKYEASLKSIGESTDKSGDKHVLYDGMDTGFRDEDDKPMVNDDYGIESQDYLMGEYVDTRFDDVNLMMPLDAPGRRNDDSYSVEDAGITDTVEDFPLLSQSSDNVQKTFSTETLKKSGCVKRINSRRGKQCELSGSSFDLKFLDSTAQLVEPSESQKFSRFSLQYAEEEDRPSGSWEHRFAGNQTLQEREKSFYAHDQKINCGFISGPKGASTGFDLAKDDARFMSSCHIAVSSCIFGNSYNLTISTNKVATRLSRKTVCFVMFIDEFTLKILSSEGQKPDNMGYIGFWKIVVVKNLPYTDMQMVGKIPKFLTHRLFPSARYSIWLDGKLQLQRDPLLILEYFLWRQGYEYAISSHYDQHCVWEEVMQNKKLNMYNQTIIDQQFALYQKDGLKRFNASDPNKLLPSYVPEGSFIARAHTPMSNLFSCLWFNEVDRFTTCDQLSFAYTYLKLRRMNPEKPFHLNMFKDCERRSIAKQYHHQAED